MGGSFKVEGPTGPFDVDVSAGTASGTLLPFRSKGVLNVSGRGRGTLYVRVVVDVPRKLSKEQKKLVADLARTMPADTIEATAMEDNRDKPFFERVKDLFG